MSSEELSVLLELLAYSCWFYSIIYISRSQYERLDFIFSKGNHCNLLLLCWDFNESSND